MITRLQNFFLKHNKWLFGSLLIVIIVTFVLTIGPQSFFGGSGPQNRESLNYYGYDLSSETDQRAMVMTAEISAILHPELQIRRDQLMNYAYMRVAGLGIADQIGIPVPNEDQLAAYVETMAGFMNPQTGEFSAESYNRIMEAMQADSRYTSGAIAQVMREDYRINGVRSALSGPDYTLPFELTQDYIDRQTDYTVRLLRFEFSDFNPEIEAADEAVEAFYNENPVVYEIPERLAVTALLFNGAAYVDEIEDPAETTLESYFTANKAKYQPEAPEVAEGEEPVEQPEVTLDEVRDAVVADWKLVQARQLAAKKSEAFSVKLWQDGVALDSPEYKALLEEFEVSTFKVPAYSRGNPPRIPQAGSALLESMWVYANNPTRYFSDISETGTGAVVLVSQGVTPARLPDFEEARPRVELAYKASEKRRLFSERGQELQAEIQGRLETESLDDVAASLSLTIEDLEPFTGATIPRPLQISTLWDQTRFLENGEISKMTIQGSTGLFTFVVEKNVPEFDSESDDYKEYLNVREGALVTSIGWTRLREISDQSLEALLGGPIVN